MCCNSYWLINMADLLYFLFDYSSKNRSYINQLINNYNLFETNIQKNYESHIVKCGFITNKDNFVDNGILNFSKFMLMFKNNELQFDKNSTTTLKPTDLITPVSICQQIYSHYKTFNIILVTKQCSNYDSNSITDAFKFFCLLSKQNVKVHTLNLDKKIASCYHFPQLNLEYANVKQTKDINVDQVTLDFCNYVIYNLVPVEFAICDYNAKNIYDKELLIQKLSNKISTFHVKYLNERCDIMVEKPRDITVLERVLGMNKNKITNSTTNQFTRFLNLTKTHPISLDEDFIYVLKINKYFFYEIRSILYANAINHDLNHGYILDEIERYHSNIQTRNRFSNYYVTVSTEFAKHYLEFCVMDSNNLNEELVKKLIIDIQLQPLKSIESITLSSNDNNNDNDSYNVDCNDNNNFNSQFVSSGLIPFGMGTVDYVPLLSESLSSLTLQNRVKIFEICEYESFTSFSQKIFNKTIYKKFKNFNYLICEIIEEYENNDFITFLKKLLNINFCNLCANCITNANLIQHCDNKQCEKICINCEKALYKTHNNDYYTPIKFSCPFCRVINYNYLQKTVEEKIYLLLNRVKNRDPNLNYSICQTCKIIYEVKHSCQDSLENNDDTDNTIINSQDSSDTTVVAKEPRICDNCIEIGESGKDIGSKKCPGCLMYIKKIDGCNHMTHIIGNFSDPNKISCHCYWCYVCEGVRKNYTFRSQIVSSSEIRYCDGKCSQH